MNLRDEILEYPYTGVITRIVEGQGDNEDTTIEVYNGIMDETMVTDDEGRVLQTSSYIISIPLTQDANDNYLIPIKGDKIALTRYGQTIYFDVDNAEPSQIGGVSIYATRKDW
jgi:hypothetical protein